MATTLPPPRVGVAAIIRHDKTGPTRVVFGKRKGSHGAGHWQFPGGHLEHGEEIEACAVRETLEETGLKVSARKVVGWTNDVFHDQGKHYITLFVLCDRDDSEQEPQVLEPEKSDGWEWKSWDDVLKMKDEDLFLPIANLKKSSLDFKKIFE